MSGKGMWRTSPWRYMCCVFWRNRTQEASFPAGGRFSPCLCSVSCALAVAGSQTPSSLALTSPASAVFRRDFGGSLFYKSYQKMPRPLLPAPRSMAVSYWEHFATKQWGARTGAAGPWRDLSVEPAWTAVLAVAAFSGHGMGAGAVGVCRQQ